MTYVLFYIIQNTEGDPTYFEIIYDRNNPTQYLDSPLLLKKFDKIIVYITVFDGYSISVKNPKITFNVPVDCEVGGFEDTSQCLDPQGNFVSCGGTKNQDRNVLRPSEYGGKECPSLTRTVDCDPCPPPVDCIVGDFEDISICMGSIQNDFGANCDGEKQQGRSILQQPLYGGQECPPLTRYVDCPPCKKVSYSFPDDITVDRTMLPFADPPFLHWTNYNVGLVENDFSGSIVIISSEYASGLINMVLSILRDSVEVDYFNLSGTVHPLYKDLLIVTSKPPILKKGDNIVLKVGVPDGYSTIIQKPTVTFSTLNPADNL